MNRGKKLIECETHISQKILAKGLGIHHETIRRILKEELGQCKVNSKWIPHSLTNSQIEQLVDISTEFLQFIEESSPQKRAPIFARNQSSFFLGNSENFMRVASCVPRTIRVKMDVEVQKKCFGYAFRSPELLTEESFHFEGV
jgi:hypothetical protein